MAPQQRNPLDQSLERLGEALARSREATALAKGTGTEALARGRSTAGVVTKLGIPVFALLLVWLLWLVATAGIFFVIPALFTGFALLMLLLRGKRLAALPAGANVPHVGMGATVASDAVLHVGSVVQMGATVASDVVLHEGSVVEMGATVGTGVVLERGAVVRMGASIGARTLLEAGATVSWGASVGKDAVIGAGAVVAAGSDVASGARVPAHTSMLPGTNWTAAMSGRLPAARTRDEQAAEPDPRSEQIRAVCDRLEQEYERAPEPVRAMFGEARGTLSSLRRTCLDLLVRERTLRAEASPEALVRLDQEKAAIEVRLAQASDEQVRRSLSGAVTAIAAQKEQRRLLQNNADRLDAELTRLIWTVDGMGTELVRVRSASVELYQGNTNEIARSVQQLQDEIDNIAQALEELNR